MYRWKVFKKDHLTKEFLEGHLDVFKKIKRCEFSSDEVRRIFLNEIEQDELVEDIC